MRSYKVCDILHIQYLLDIFIMCINLETLNSINLETSMNL